MDIPDKISITTSVVPSSVSFDVPRIDDEPLIMDVLARLDRIEQVLNELLGTKLN